MDANAAPRVNRVAIQVRGSEASRGGYSDGFAFALGSFNKLVKHVCLARTGWPGQQHALACPHYL
jgi:hypothetical protein